MIPFDPAWWKDMNHRLAESPGIADDDATPPQRPEHDVEWMTLRQQYPILRAATPSANEPVMSAHDPQFAAAVIAVLLQPATKELIRNVLLDMLASSIGELAGELLGKDVHHG